MRYAAVLAVLAGLGAPAAAEGRTLTVCRHGCDATRIARAVAKARPGDTVRVRPGVYRESVEIGRPRVRLIGDRRHPARVTLDGRRARGRLRQNAVLIRDARGVTVSGFRARHYKATGFFALRSDDYRFSHLLADRTGAYGLYAYDAKGGRMEHSEAHYNGDSAIYIGGTPPQSRPRRTLVRDVEGWGSPIGYAGTNSRYVTITGSRFYNNATGILIGASRAEKDPPPEGNTIVGNEIFWNNFDVSRGAPFEPVTGGITFIAPAGTGILLFGGRRERVEDNEISGNFLAGVALLEGLFGGDDAGVRALAGNAVVDNRFGLGGADRNGRDLVYDGSGSGNCFASNEGVEVTLPADASRFPACPFTGANAFDADVQRQIVSFAGSGAVPNWIRHPHRTRAGVRPLEVYSPGS